MKQLTVIHNLLGLHPPVTCNVHRDWVNEKYNCSCMLDLVLWSLWESVSFAQRNLHTATTLRRPPQNRLSFQCGADALEAQNESFSFPASTTSCIVARLRSLRQRHYPLPPPPSTDTTRLFSTAIPRHTLLTWRSCRYLSSPHTLKFA